MTRYRNKTIYTEVEVDLGEFTTEDLVEELNDRGSFVGDEESKDLLIKIYENRRLGKDYQQELDKFIYHTLGFVI